VETIEHGGSRRYFPSGEFSREDARQRCVLESGSNREVYEALQETPDASMRELARRLDLSASRVHRAISKLREVGLADR